MPKPSLKNKALLIGGTAAALAGGAAGRLSSLNKSRNEHGRPDIGKAEYMGRASGSSIVSYAVPIFGAAAADYAGRTVADKKHRSDLKKKMKKTANQTHDLVFYENRSTPQVIPKASMPKPREGYGDQIKRRAATPKEEKVIGAGRWLRVDVDGNNPSSDDYKKTDYRPQLLSKAAEQAVDKMYKEAGQVNETLTALDTDFSNPTNAKLQQLAKQQQKEINTMNKAKKPKVTKIVKIAYDQFSYILEPNRKGIAENA